MSWLQYVAGAILLTVLWSALTWAWRHLAGGRSLAQVVSPLPVDSIRPDDPGWAEVDPLLTARKRIEAIAAARRMWGLNFNDAKRLIEERSR